MVQHYELLLIYPGTQTDEEALTRVTAIEALLKQHGANITLHDFWGKRKLAYEIEHIRQGYYDLYEFDLEATSLQKLDTALRLNDMVLRHQILRKELKSAEKLAEEAALRERIAARREAGREQEQAAQIASETPVAVKPVDSAPVAPEQLDKKLEEILESDSVQV